MTKKSWVPACYEPFLRKRGFHLIRSPKRGWLADFFLSSEDGYRYASDQFWIAFHIDRGTMDVWIGSNEKPTEYYAPERILDEIEGRNESYYDVPTDTFLHDKLVEGLDRNYKEIGDALARQKDREGMKRMPARSLDGL